MKTLHEFKIGQREFQIYQEKEKVKLKSGDYDSEIDIPFEGSYDTTTPTSTYDEKGLRLLRFENFRLNRKAEIDVTIKENGDYWQYGAHQDDDWRSFGERVTTKRLEVMVEQGEVKTEVHFVSRKRE